VAVRTHIAAGLSVVAFVSFALPCDVALAAPAVQVTAPAPSQSVSGPMTLGADASADAVKVQWYVDQIQVASDADGAPWTQVWDSARAANGVHKVYAKAADAGGSWASAPSVSFTVDNPVPAVDTTAPTVAVSAPKWGDVVSGEAVTLAAAAFDNVAVTRVKWYVDGAEVASDSAAPWTRSWNSRRIANGPHRIFAKARDAAGNWGSSTSVTVNVSNPPCGASAPAPASWDHVVWIVFENKSYRQIVGSSNAPYLNGLAAACGLATDYHAVAHPSLPNYIAMTSGSTQGITDDTGPAMHPLVAPSLFSQLGTGGWRALQESMPSNCHPYNSGLYAVRHNPAAYFVGLNTDCPGQDVPLGATPDVSARFTFVTPDLCDDMHSSTCATDIPAEVSAGDAWLAKFLPPVLASPEYRAGSTAIFITWDEDDNTAVQHIPTLVVAPSVPPGTAASTTFDHYSLLRTTEEMLGITPYLGNAATAASMREPFGL
jgi:phosphatidylinositol-3-phosphatase